MPTHPTFGLWFDFRYPEDATSREAAYRSTLEQIVRAEAAGFDSVWLTEHHFQNDGYTPSPLIIAAAIGAATTTLRIGTNLALLPLYHPVRLAEEAATLSLLTGGRFDLGVGAGYVEREYSAFGRQLKHRPSLMEEALTVIRQAWTGAPLSHRGKRHQFEGIQVSPVPETLPRLLVGAVAPPAIARAARLADGFLDSGGAGQAAYVQAVTDAGRKASDAAIFQGCWDIVCNDPDQGLAALGDALLRQMRGYQAMGAFPDATLDKPEQAVMQGFYRFLTPGQMVESIMQQLERYPQTRDIHFWGRFPGESNTSAEARMALLAAEVLPRVRERVARQQIDKERKTV